MKNTSKPLAARLLTLAAALALSAIPALAETVEIDSAADWAAFANRVNSGETALDAKLTANVTLTQDAPFAGNTTSRAYAGTFDGAGHTLRVAWSFSDGTEHVAPFRYANACTIKDLHVTGTLQSNGKFVAGFIGECLRNSNSRYTYVNNCRSSVIITCAITGDSTSGGFVGHLESANSARVECKNCLFDGSLLGPTANSCGGFTGYRPGAAYAKYYNCLFAPTDVTVGPYSSWTFSRGGNDALDKCYYMQSFGTAEGTDASGMSAEALASALGGAWTVANGQVVLALFPTPAVPPEPAAEGFTYQGALKEISGAPLTGVKTVEFRLYDAATGGTPLWGRSCKVFLNDKGLFNIGLSDEVGDAIEGTTSTAPLAALLARASASPLYVGLTVVGSDGEIAPRQRLLPVPYASFAADSANAAGDFAVGGTLSSAGLVVSGRTDISGKATVKGNAAVKGNLAVSGKILGPGSKPARGTAPVGAIVIWSGAANRVPDGWALCDGSNGTPDLRGRFVVGHDPSDGDYSVGKTGGEKTHTLTVDQMPSHNHNISLSIWGYVDPRKNLWEFAAPDGYYSNKQNIDSAYAGGGRAHENRPPYYALCYIMRVK